MKKFLIGIDIGGTSIKFGLFDREINLMEKWSIITNTNENGNSIIKDIKESINDKLKTLEISKHEISGVGLGAPGAVDSDGVIYGAENLGWKTFNLKNEIENALDLRCECLNDANVALIGELGELTKFNNKNIKNAVLLTIGTGIGCGIFIDNKIIFGNRGYAGEIGHMKVSDESDILCNCGKYGCLESLASAVGIIRYTENYLYNSQEKSSLRDVEILDSKILFKHAQEGDEVANKMVEFMSEKIAQACLNIAVTIDPEVFIIGGGISKAGEYFVEKVRKHYKNLAFSDTQDIDFELAKLGNKAGIYGAARQVK